MNITLPKELTERLKEYQESNTGYETFVLSKFVKKRLDEYLTEKGYQKRTEDSTGNEQKCLPEETKSATENRLQKGQNKKLIRKICANCGEKFKTNNPRAKFCKDACKSADYRKRRTEKSD